MTTKRVCLLAALLGAFAGRIEASPVLGLGAAMALPGQVADVRVWLTGLTSPCAGLNAKVNLPGTISLSGVEAGGMLGAGGFAIDYRTFSGGATFLAYSGSGPFRGRDGVALHLKLLVPTDMAPGVYDLTFADANTNIHVNSRHALSDATGATSLAHTVTAGTLAVDTDTDGDGMGDGWENTHFGSLARNGTGDFDGDDADDLTEFNHGTLPETMDSDGDGLTDGQELIAGTDGLDGYDCFEIRDMGAVANTGQIAIYWDSREGRLYTVEGAATLGAVWTPIHQVEGNGQRQVWSNPDPGAVWRFFRLEVKPAP